MTIAAEARKDDQASSGDHEWRLLGSAKSGLQVALYRVFVVSVSIAVVLGLLLIWGFKPGSPTLIFLVRVVVTCVVLALASALAISANRLVEGRRPPEDDGG